MARVHGPMLSFSASGPFARLLSFGATLARPYARRTIGHKDPKTPAQVATRAMFQFLSNQWPLLSPANQLSWGWLAGDAQIARSNAYRGLNLSRWHRFLPPSKTCPPTETGVQPNAILEAAYGGPSYIKLSFYVYATNDVWGALVFRSLPTVFTPSRDKTIAVIPITHRFYTYYTDHGLSPGKYNYSAMFFTTSGSLGPQEATVGAWAT